VSNAFKTFAVYGEDSSQQPKSETKESYSSSSKSHEEGGYRFLFNRVQKERKISIPVAFLNAPITIGNTPSDHFMHLIKID